MFLADHRRTAWIKAPKSLLPYKGLQQYERFREEVLTNKEVWLPLVLHCSSDQLFQIKLLMFPIFVF